MASRRIAGITIEIGGDTTKLNTALREVDKQISTTASALRDTNKLLKLDPGNTELLVQKQKNLSAEINATKQRLSELKNVSKESMTPEQWDALQREIIETEQKLKSLESEYKNFGSVSAQQIQAAGGKMQEIGGKISEAGGKIKDVGSTLTTHLTLPFAAVATAATKNFAEVDKTMTLTNSTMKNTESEAKMLESAMKDAASNSTYSMQDAATATLNFARAGLDANQAAATLAPAMNLAAGEGGNLDTVSAGLVATMNGFHDSFDNAGQYADVFANACNNSALDVDGLSNAMSVAAPVFSAAGYSVNDAALYMGTMANAGIDADKAANSLKTGMARLVDPAKSGAEWMKKLGIEVTNSDGSMKDSVQVQQELHDAFSGLSESEQIAAASAIFGKNQMSPWLALIRTSPDDVQGLSDALSEEGTAAQMAEDMMSGFGGSMEKLKSTIDVAAYNLGEALAPTIQKVTDKIQQAVDWFNSLDESQKETIAKVGLVVAAIGPLLTAGGTLISGIGSIISIGGTLLSGIGAVVGFLGGPLTIAIMAVVAVGALLIANWDKIKDFAGKMKDAVVEKWNALKDGISTAIDSIKSAVSEKWNAIKSAVDTVINAIKTAVSTAWNAIKAATSTAFNAVKTVASTVWNGIKTAITTVINAIKTGVTTAWNGIKTATSTVFNAVKTVVDTVWNGIKTAVTTAVNAVKTTVMNVWNGIKTTTSTVWNGIKTAVTTVVNGLKSAVTSPLNAVKNTFETVFNGIKTHVNKVVEWLKGIFNFKWELPKIKLPHFKLTGEFSLKKKTVPKLTVEWYKKAYDDPVLFNSPTVLPTASGLKGFGDGNGAEIVMGLNKLRQLVGTTGNTTTINVYGAVGQDVNELAEIVSDKINKQVYRNRAVFA